MNEAVLVLGVQQSESVIHIHVYIFEILFPFRLLHNIEQSLLFYTIDPSWLLILNLAVYTCQSQTPSVPVPTPTPPSLTINSFSKSGNQFLFCKQAHLYLFLFFKILQISGIILSFSARQTSLIMTVSGSTHLAANGIVSFFLMTE